MLKQGEKYFAASYVGQEGSRLGLRFIFEGLYAHVAIIGIFDT